MSLRATEHAFTGDTVSIALYNPAKTSLGTLMIQKTGRNPEENFVGPFPVAVARPMEESTAVPTMFPSIINFSATIDWVFLLEQNLAQTKRIIMYEYNKSTSTYNWKGFITANVNTATNYNRGFRALRYLHTTGTVGVAAPALYSATSDDGTVSAVVATGIVTGVGTAFELAHIGMMIGFGSTDPTLINSWYPIITFTDTTHITVYGLSSAIAVLTPYVIVKCTVTGADGADFVAELIAAGTGTAAIAGGLGPRIGFGSNVPSEITNWYHIGVITDATHLNLTTSPGVIATGTLYVIEELRFAIALTNSPVENGGLFLLKGAGYHDFTTSGITFPIIASAVDNQRGVYWLNDAQGSAGVVSNTAPSGIALEDEISKTEHWAYVLNGVAGTSAKIFKYNLRANGVVTAGKMTLVLNTSVIITGAFTVTGTITNSLLNNGIIATLKHGPGVNSPYFYFVTATRLYCAAVSDITDGNTAWTSTSVARQEVPTGGISTFPASGSMMNVAYISSIDRLVITTYAAGAGYRQYVTKYPITDGTPFDHIFGIDDKQADQSFLSPQAVIHFNTGSMILTTDANNGVIHICRTNTAFAGTTDDLHRMYALPFGAHWTYAYTASPANHQRVITPSMATVGCVKFDQVLVLDDDYLGSGELRLSTEPYRIYYRTANIATDATSSWVLLGDSGDLSAVAAAEAIQFMFEFFVIGWTCLPARIMKVIVVYEDGATDSHYQLSVSLSSIATKRFVWRFSQPFGGIVPTLKVQLFNTDDADIETSLFTDTTVASAHGTWEKSIDGAVTAWTAYDSADKINETTYISYTPLSGEVVDNIKVRALLTQN